jgi:hypothetical protein
MFYQKHKIIIRGTICCLLSSATLAVEAKDPINDKDKIEALEEQNTVLGLRLKKLERAMQKVLTHRDNSPVTISSEVARKTITQITPIKKAKNKLNVKVSGYIKADVLYDLDAKSGDRINYGSIPLSGSTSDKTTGHFRMHARESRISIQSKIDTSMGQLKTVIEGDFYGGGTNSPAGSEVISNSVNFRLRHAYVQLGGWLFGQTWSNYVDVKSFPENLDFSNDTGQAFLRQSQLKYTMPYNDFVLSFSFENPEADFIDDVGVKRSNGRDAMPDISGRILYKKSWGHVSLQSIFRKFMVDDGTYEASSNGFGLGLSGKINFFDDDQLRFHLSSGDGVGRYIQEAANTAAAVTGVGTANLDMQTQRATGGYIGYQHLWTENIRSNFNAGFLAVDWNESVLGSAVTNLQNKNLYSYHVNIIWQVITAAELGIEFSKAHREQVDGQRGEVNRLQFSAKYKF